MKRAILIGMALATGLVAGNASAVTGTFYSADFTTDQTLSCPAILQQPLFVRDDATLTIPAGCIVRGQPRTSAVVPGNIIGTPGALIVTQRGRIRVLGTPESPVIFTTCAVDADKNGVADDADANGFEDECLAGTPDADLYDNDPINSPLAPLDANGNSNVGLWGGLVVLGNAPTNLANTASVGYGKSTVEGLTVPGFPVDRVTFGGTNPHDNSGSIQYASIRHAGDEIGDGNELNGLTLGAVGDGTVIRNVEVYANFDDGFEWFGGTVHGSRLAVWFVGDDMFDLDQGYTGINQFLLGVAPWFNETSSVCAGAPIAPTEPFGSVSGDKGGEFDGDDYNPDGTIFDGNLNIRANAESLSVIDRTPWPLSFPSFYNVTLVGANVSLANRGSGGGTVTGPEFGGVNVLCTPKRGFQARNGFAGTIFNSIVVNTSTEEGLEIDGDVAMVAGGIDGCPAGQSTGLGGNQIPAAGREGAPCFGADENVQRAGVDNTQQVWASTTNGLTRILCSTFDDTGALDATETEAVTDGDELSESLRGLSPTVTSDNNVVNGAFTNLVNEDQTFDPSGDANGKITVGLKTNLFNPRPQGLTGVAGCVAPQFPGGDTSAVYRGAFPAGAPTLWTTPWSVMSGGRMIAN